MDYIDYRELLGIGCSDKDKQVLFSSRVQVFLQAQKNIPFEEQQETVFCYQIGEKCLLENKPLFDIEALTSGSEGLQRVWLYLRNKGFADMLACIVIFANTYNGTRKNRNTIIGAIEKALEDSHIQYEIVRDSDGVFLLPKGAKELDDALVSKPLKWLSAYPKARTAFVKALKEYANATPDNASDVADKLRKTLETFLREFFNNSAPLEKNKVEYGRYLKSRGIPSEITGNMETLLQMYANFMNGYAKHQDATSVNVLEYIMYQTGNIIRLLITLKQEENKNTN